MQRFDFLLDKHRRYMGRRRSVHLRVLSGLRAQAATPATHAAVSGAAKAAHEDRSRGSRGPRWQQEAPPRKRAGWATPLSPARIRMTPAGSILERARGLVGLALARQLVQRPFAHYDTFIRSAAQTLPVPFAGPAVGIVPPANPSGPGDTRRRALESRLDAEGLEGLVRVWRLGF